MYIYMYSYLIQPPSPGAGHEKDGEGHDAAAGEGVGLSAVPEVDALSPSAMSPPVRSPARCPYYTIRR